MIMAAAQRKPASSHLSGRGAVRPAACSLHIGVLDGLFDHLRDGGLGVGRDTVFRIRTWNGSHAGLRALLSGAGRDCRDRDRSSCQQSVQTCARGRSADWHIALKFSLPAVIAAIAGASLLNGFAALPAIVSYTMGGRTHEITAIGVVIGLLIVAFACSNSVQDLPI